MKICKYRVSCYCRESSDVYRDIHQAINDVRLVKVTLSFTHVFTYVWK